MLHIINNFPISSSFFDTTQSGDTIIFTDNAVLAVRKENFEAVSLPKKIFNHINLCVRKADLLIRNIPDNELLRGVTVIDDLQYEDVMSHEAVFRSYN